MQSNQFYKIAAGILLLLNLAMISFFFLTKPPHPHGVNNRSFVRPADEIMQLDKDQNSQFLELASKHTKQIKTLEAEQRELLKPYFLSTIDSPNQSVSDSLVNEILRIEKQKIEKTQDHFQEVKSILKPEQKDKFKTFLEESLNFILSDNKNSHHRKK